ncbi:ABC transporter ATP-binding protein [filamentous cyanobacterium LEGE 11480]|uniref:ABC transporter ATP-binding protein n=1 Tax=Romeriopsis navalis LEGE 11480 TaxID=2777977 RepID=A0A928VS15_9CYAN|nr:ABC transporter ATP-binding protein [Romeriopsis navalis]MBE9031510.1 ABC transporter ATP-binding protein [Romeriopsis navalis LEGE 11480]
MTANRLLLKFARRSPRLVILTTVLGFSGALFNGISTALVVPVILGYLGQSAGTQSLPGPLKKILDLTGAQGDQQFLVLMGFVLLAIILKNAATYAGELTSARLTQTLTTGIRNDGLKMLLDVDLEYYSANKIGDIVNQMGGEIARTANSIKCATQIATTAITILVFLGILLTISWQLTLVSTSLLAMVSVANQFFIRKAKRMGQKLSSSSANYSIALLETLSGMRLVKSTGQEAAQYRQLSHYVNERELAERQSQTNYAIVNPINEVSGILVVLTIVITGKVLFASQMAAPTLLLMYLLTLFRMLPSIGRINGLRSQFANTAPSVQVVNAFLRYDDKPIMAQGKTPYQPITQGIQFQNIWFKYPTSQDWILRDVSLNLPKGTTLALVGSSGAGKSTLADLLPRFYDCQEGGISLDGQDIRSFDLPSFRKSMGIVSQETFLFNASVFDNIAYGCENVSFDAVVSAAQRANAYEFIEKLPEGLDTQIGDRGVMLSGGQRQRLAIARALLRDPDILILDEATSALDTVSERLVQKALDELSRDRTVLVIAHRLSTIQNADQIAVFDRGEVVEVGVHDELLARKGLYAKLYNMQFGETVAPAGADMTVEPPAVEPPAVEPCC